MLDNIALGILIFVTLILFYGIIAIHDIPYEIAKKRQHPQQDSIHVAGWVSLFTLHIIWPFLWIWATLYRPDRGWGFIDETEKKKILAELQSTVDQLQTKLHTIESEEKISSNLLQEQLTKLQHRMVGIELIANKKNNENEEQI